MDFAELDKYLEQKAKEKKEKNDSDLKDNSRKSEDSQ